MVSRQPHKNFLKPRRCLKNLNPRRAIQRLSCSHSAPLRERKPSPPIGSGQNQSGIATHAACNRSTRRAGARGGGCAANPRCVRIRSITAGSSIAAMTFSLPPHCSQRSRSRSKTRFRSRAHVMRTRAPCACAQSPACPVVVCAGGVGTIAARSLALGASAP